MASWKVDTGRLKEKSGEVHHVSEKVEIIAENVGRIGNLDGLSFKGKAELRSRIKHLADSLSEQSEVLERMGDCLLSTAYLYESAEKNIKDFSKQEKLILSESAKTAGTEDDSQIENYLKAILTLWEKSGTEEGAGVASKLYDYFRNLFGFVFGNEEALTWKSFFSVADSSIDLWTKYYDFLEKKFPGGYFADKWGEGVAGIGIIGSLFGLAGNLAKAMDSDSTTAAGLAADYIDYLGSGTVDVTKSIYEFANYAKLSKMEMGVYTPAGLYATLADTIIGTGTQGIRSVEKYLADGEWDIMDTSRTGVEVSVAGLEKIISGLTFNIISAETFGTTPEEISNGLQNWAGGVGTSAGNYIVDHADWYNEYQNSDVFGRFLITMKASVCSAFGW